MKPKEKGEDKSSPQAQSDHLMSYDLVSAQVI